MERFQSTSEAVRPRGEAGVIGSTRDRLEPPSIAYLSFASGASRLVPPVSDDIVVIDGFWPDAARLRQIALAAPFEPKLSPSGFAFREWLSTRSHSLRMAELASRACGAHLLEVDCQSRFVFETALDERQTRERVWIHYDRWQLVGVLYLVPDQIARGGTGFYRHLATGLSSVQEADAMGFRARIMADSTNDAAWAQIASVPMRFNRMVLFKPHIFHQALEYFGSTVEDGRLYCIVAFENSGEGEA